MVGNRQIQTGTLIAGIAIGFILFAIFRSLFYILIGVAIGALLVAFFARRR